MAADDRSGVHLVVGGYPAGQSAGHDMDDVRLRLLALAAERPDVTVTVANDFADLARWLPTCRLLVTYTAGPYPDGEVLAALETWLRAGNRWFALHGTAGGRAAPVSPGSRARKMVRTGHHDLLGGFFLNHPPIRRIAVDVAAAPHRLTRGLPTSFEVADEPYLIELTDPANTEVLLTTVYPEGMSAEPFGFTVVEDTSPLPDGSRALGLVHTVGDGGVAYVALGHNHSPVTSIQPWVDRSVDPDGVTPPWFRGPWEHDSYTALLRNGLGWGLGED